MRIDATTALVSQCSVIMKLNQPVWPRFLPTSFVLNMATLGPVGSRLPAPGTWGSVAGLMYFTVFFYPLGSLGILLGSALGIYLAVGFCGEAEFRMGRRDPSQVVLDEFVALPLCLLGWQSLATVYPRWVVFLSAFAVFRLYDITKPFGIARLQDLPGGWGVVADDVAAAFATAATLHVLAFLAARLGA